MHTTRCRRVMLSKRDSPQTEQIESYFEIKLNSCIRIALRVTFCRAPLEQRAQTLRNHRGGGSQVTKAFVAGLLLNGSAVVLVAGHMRCARTVEQRTTLGHAYSSPRAVPFNCTNLFSRGMRKRLVRYWNKRLSIVASCPQSKKKERNFRPPHPTGMAAIRRGGNRTGALASDRQRVRKAWRLCTPSHRARRGRLKSNKAQLECTLQHCVFCHWHCQQATAAGSQKRKPNCRCSSGHAGLPLLAN